jgi:hypothetical protein
MTKDESVKPPSTSRFHEGSRATFVCLALGLAVLTASVGGCRDGRSARLGAWEGQIDSLPGGTVMVQNLGHGLWADGAGWQLTEELRLGSLDADGPENFGRVTSVAVDDRGRMWVLEGHAGELRVFDAAGAHVRTIGRMGEGPGEFRQPVRVDVGPAGDMWVMDPRNTRLSVFDSAGEYLSGIQVPGGFVILPWQGGFDERGSYYAPVASFEPEFSIALGRFDQGFVPLDTIRLPVDPVERGSFDIVSDGRVRVSAGIPFQGGLLWRLTRRGTIWALITDQYRLMEFGPDGDTLRVATKVHQPVPVSAEERAEALEGMRWFTDQGGKVDASRIPTEKPLAFSFFVDQEGFVWVARTESAEEDRQTFEVFDPEGQYLGEVVAPFRLQVSPAPIRIGDLLYGVVRDELDVPYLVRARLTRPEG